MSAAMHVQAAAAVTPPSSLGVRADAIAAVWYPLHAGAGTSIACKLGRGPALTLAGTGTPWANWGTVTPNGTDNVITGPATDAELDALFRLDTLEGQMLVVGWRRISDGDWTAVEGDFWYGRAVSGDGGWGMDHSATEQGRIAIRGIDGASNLGTGLVATNTNSADQYLLITTLVGKAGGLADAKRVRCNLTTGAVDYSTLLQNLDLRGNGTSVAGINGNSTLTLMGVRNTSAYGSLMNAGASNARMDGFFAARLPATTVDAADALLEHLRLDLLAAPRDFPMSLRVAP